VVEVRWWSRPAVLPVLVFVVWRAVHAAGVLAFGGGLGETTYAFDGAFYLSVLRDGYVLPPGGYGQFSNVAFFPGLAWITGAVQLVVRSEGVATALVANGLALASFVAVWGAVRAWTEDDGVARRAVIALALVPTSYYLWMYYSEALLVSASASAAWCSRTERHGRAGALLLVAATSRVVGVLVGPVLALVRVVRLRRIDLVAVLYAAASSAGFALVLARQAIEIDDPLGWTKAQEAWGRQMAPPWTPLVNAIRDLTGKLPDVAEGVGLDLVTVIATGALVAVLLAGARRRHWPMEAPALAVTFWFVPLCSRLISSQVRFALGCWPVLLVPARTWPRLAFTLRVVLALAAVGLTAVLLRRLAIGAFTA
jgi:hypothetical protein